jgi:site-specific recombinase XerD
MSALSTLFEQFIRERRYLKNVTPKTVIWYQTAFDALTRTVAVSAPSDLTKPILQDSVVRLRERGLSPVSCNTYVKAINALLAWLHAEGYLSTALSLSPQRTEKRVVQTLSDDQLRRLLAFKPKSAAQWRAYALACALTDTGVRIDELLRFRPARL